MYKTNITFMVEVVGSPLSVDHLQNTSILNPIVVARVAVMAIDN